MDEFESIIAASWSQGELDNATIRETDAYINGMVYLMTLHVARVGDAR